jgi:hypothetical protein
MNERIRELAEQAGLEFDDDLVLEPEAIYYTTQKDLEKFAELIVQECLLKIENERFELPDFIIDSVKQHFGVEE